MKFLIGTETTLSEIDWCKAFTATLDADGDQTEETFTFILNNRYDDDNEDAKLIEHYAHQCHYTRS